ncbi:MAG: M48 family metallopeptidase [Clostridiales bacterium]|jgi:predicted metal-dependent hydrolase|nr:M48 family metallopeptidase [Clostridiales bacterium]
MKLSFQYETKNIEFEVIYRVRKTLSIKVELDGKVTVIAPALLKEEEVLEIVKKKAKWILEKQGEVSIINKNKIKREAVNGEYYLYLGREYKLFLDINNTYKKIEVNLLEGRLIVKTYTRDAKTIKLALEKFYRERTLIKVRERVSHYQKYFEVKPRNIKSKEQKKRWGSCTYNNDLLFNWRISMAPLHVLDYIVVHEMSHMIHKDHSRNFWNKVGSILPDYKIRHDWLKRNGVTLNI